MPKIVLDNWSGGLWTAGPPVKNPPRTCTRAINVEFWDEGTVRTRSGSSRVFALADTTDGVLISGLHFFKANESVHTIYNDIATSLGFTQTGDRLRVAAMTTTGLVDDIVFFPVCMKKVYAGVVYNWGISDTPAAAVPVAAGISPLGNLTGDYTYMLSFYNSTVKTESALSAVSITVTVVQDNVVVTLPTTSTDSQVDKVRIYRTAGGITGVWYFVDEVALGVGTYTDSVPDVGLGSTPIDQNMMAPLTCNVAGKYKNRMLTLDLTTAPRYIYPSLASTPESYSVLINTLLMDAGDTAEAVLEMGDYAIVLGRRGIYAVQIDTNGIIYTARVVSGKGTVNGRTVSMGDLGIYFLSDDGVYVISGFNVYKMSDNIEAIFKDTDRGGMSTIADFTKTSGTFVGGRYYLHYYGVDAQWHAVVYNERKQRWKHYIGWRWTSLPDEGSYPFVGLPDFIGHNDFSMTTDVGTVFPSEVGFALPTAPTALMDLRTFRLSLECVGTVTVEFWDGDALQYSVDFTDYSYGDAYLKHSLPLGTYFLQPEVRISCPDQPFTLKLFEADVDYVRKYEADYTRSYLGNSGSPGNSTQTG